MTTVSELIPISRPILSPNAKNLVSRCIEEGWISGDGKYVKAFEESYCKLVNRKFAVAVSNGSNALVVALKALGIGPGDEVIVPAFTIISCAAAVVQLGAVPVFCDCDVRDWNLKVDDVSGLITERTRAVIAAHTYGLSVEMERLGELLDSRGIYLIEDAAEAHCLSRFDRPCGSFGIISTFSFYANKLITTGEGGMVLTDDEHLAQKCRSLRNLCFGESDRFVHEELGWNFRMSNLQAALGLAQLEICTDIAARKRAIGEQYQTLLSHCRSLQLPLDCIPAAKNGYWVFAVLCLDDTVNVEELSGKFRDRGIEVRRLFHPLHRQPVLNRMGYGNDQSLPNSEYIRARGLCLPAGPDLCNRDLEHVARTVLELVS